MWTELIATPAHAQYDTQEVDVKRVCLHFFSKRIFKFVVEHNVTALCFDYFDQTDISIFDKTNVIVIFEKLFVRTFHV